MTPVVQYLLVANVLMFVLQISVPGFGNSLVYIPALAMVRPWTIITYMFLHGSPTHLFMNMLGLFFFGPRVEERLGSQRFTILYFISGLSGAVLSAIFSFGAPIVGASAGVFGVMMGFAHFWPNQPIHIWMIIPIPARILVIITTVMAISSGFSGRGDGIAHFAHLGGYAGAYVYLRRLDASRGAFKRQATAAPAGAANRLDRWRSIDLSKVHQANRDEVGRLMEKIDRQGVRSLSGQEVNFLASFIPPEVSPGPGAPG